MSEHEKIFQHIETLEREGRLNEEELADVERRIRTATELQMREIDRRIEEIRETHAPKPIKQTTVQKVATIIIVVALAGALLEMTLGEGFIFISADVYRSIAKWVFGALLPLATVAFYRMPKVEMFSNSFLNRWIIRPFTYLLAPMMLSGFIVIAPLGYMTLAGVLLPGEHVAMDARVTAVGIFSKRSRSCDQKATLQLA
jgi:hypothetical protein